MRLAAASGVAGERLPRFSAALTWVYLSAWLLVQLSIAVIFSLWFDNYEADGTFQLFNPLRRIGAGQRGGVDFQFFHGLGLPYLHFPLYWMAGSSLFSAELSRYLVSLFLFLLTTAAFFRALSGTRRDALLLTAASLALSSRLFELYMPSNSLLGVRSALPIMVGTVLLLDMPASRKGLLAGAATGVALLIGVEQGVAIALALVLVQTVRIVARRGSRDEILFLVVAVSVAGATASLLLLLMGGVEGAERALWYQFREVPLDQFWYFGAMPGAFFYQWSQIAAFGRTVPKFVLGALGALAMLALMARRPGGRDGRYATAMATLLTYALIGHYPYLGIASAKYGLPLTRVLILGLLAGAFLYGPRVLEWARRKDGHGAVRPATPGALALVVLSLFGLVGLGRVVIRNEPGLAAAVAELREGPNPWRPRLSHRWQQDLRRANAVVRSAAIGRQPRIWSTYAGILEAEYGVFHPSFDYIIHALGPVNRTRYADDFVRTSPDVVQTLRRRASGYEEWLQDEHWDFYGSLLARYEVADTTSRAILWRPRRSGAMPAPLARDLALGPKGGITSLQLAASPLERLAIVRLSYDIHNSGASIPLLRQTARYFVRVVEMAPAVDTVAPNADAELAGMLGARGSLPISLPPYWGSFTFPVVVPPGSMPGLEFRAYSLLSGVRLTPTALSVRVVELSARDRVAFAEAVCTGQTCPMPPVQPRN